MKKIILIVGIIVIVIVVVILLAQGTNVKEPADNSLNNGGVVQVGAKVLDLSSQGLKSIPSYVFDITDLEKLNVSHNNLAGAIQSQIGNLKSLRTLNASYNKMTGVPAEIGQLQNLESLDLSYNQLTGLPNELGNLQKLKILNLTGNNYSQQDLDYIHSKLPLDTSIIVK